MEYEVFESEGKIQWIKRRSGNFIVDPKSVADFQKEYPDAVQVFYSEEDNITKESRSEEETNNGQIHGQL